MRYRHAWFANSPDPGARDSRWSPSASFATRTAFVLLGLMLGLGVFTRPSFAVDYYVDQNNPSCSNSGAGTIAQPYCTISAAVSARSIAGNRIFVNPGRYREQVTVAGSGTAASPIIIQATGPGVIVDGSNDFANAALWTLSSGTVYLAATVTTGPIQVFADGLRLAEAASAVTPATLPSGQFKYVGGQGLYVNLGGPNPGSRQAQVGVRNYGFRLDRRSYVRVQGFEARNHESRSFYLTGPLNGTEIIGNKALWSGKNGIAAVSCSSVVVRGNEVGHHLDHCIMFQDTKNSTIEDNDTHNGYRPAVRAANGVYLTGSDNNLIRRNRAHHNQDTGFNFTSGADNNVSLQNLSYLNGDHGTDHTGSVGNVHIGDVWYRNYKDGFSAEGNSPGSQVFNCIGIENGVAVNPVDGGLEFNLWVDDNSSVGFQSDYNVWWNSNPSIHPIKYDATRYLTAAAFSSATGHDAHSITANPMFVDTTGAANFRLDDGSPAIDRGTSAVANWPSTDFLGNARNDDPSRPNLGAGPVPYTEIGAYEFSPNVNPVAVLSVDPSNGLGPLPVVANGAGSTDDGTIVSYRFDFGDGTVIGPQASSTANHTYAVGEWNLTLTVTDNRGGTDTASVPVVSSANLIGNPSFEANVTGWAPTSGSAMTRVAGGFDGGFSVQVAGPAAGTATFGLNDSPNWINTTNAINTRYRFTAWVRSTSHTGRIKVMLREFNAGVLQATSNGPEVPLTTSWQLLTVDHLSRMIGSTLDYQVINRPNVAGEVFLADNLTARIVNLDRAPLVTAPPTTAVSELQPVVIQVSALDPDGEQLGLTADFSGLPVGHSATFVVDSSNTNGTFTWTPTYNHAQAQPYSVTFRATNILVGTATTQITVNNADPAPIVIAPPATPAQEGTLVSFVVTATDPDSTPIASFGMNAAGLPAGHDAAFAPAPGNASGTFTWTPSFSTAPGTYSVIFTATNTSSGADTALITVSNVDLAPVVTAPAVFVAGEGASDTLRISALDPDGQPIDSLTADLSGLPVGHNAVFTANPTRTAGTVVWTPSIGTPPGPYRVFFRAKNGLIGRDTTDISVNRKPVVSAPGTAVVGESLPLSVQVTVADADGDPISGLTANFSALPAGHNAVFTPAGDRLSGTLTWTPTAADGRAAPYAVSFTAISGTLSGTGTTMITVDQPPVVSVPGSVTVTETNLLTVNVTANDPDAQAITALTADVSGLPPGHNAVFTPAGDRLSGTLTWTPAAADGRIPPYSVVFTATNALTGSSTTTIVVDQPPVVVTPGTVTGPENAPLSVTVTASDPDGQAITSLTASLTGLPAGHNSVFTPDAGNVSGTLTWTPTFDDSGTYTVSVTAANALSSGSSNATLHVTNVDRAPLVTVPATQAVGEGDLLTTTVIASDPDGDAIGALTPDFSGLPAGHNATFTPAVGNASGTFTWRPNAGDGNHADYAVSFTATNAMSGSATTSIHVDRHPVVTAPATAGADENVEVVVNVSAVDPDGQPITGLTADMSTLPAGHGATFTTSVDHTTGTFRWTPSYLSAPGPYAVSFTASNTTPGSAVTSISVVNHDRPPVLDCPAVVVGGERTRITMTVAATDPDLEPITDLFADLAALPLTSDATFTPSPDKSTGTLSWTPVSGDGDASPYIVTFMASNAMGAANATAIIVDRYPRVTNAATASVQETSVVVVPVTVNDPDFDEVMSLTVDLSELPAGHNAVFTSSPDHLSGSLSWKPTYDDARLAPYRVRFIAANALAETTTTMITVTQRDRPPVLSVPANLLAVEGAPYTFAVTVTDPEGDPIDQLTGDLSTLPLGHTATFTAAGDHASGTFSWIPPPAAAPGPYALSFTTVANGLTTTTSASLRIDRHPVITAPATTSAPENAPLTVTFAIDDLDGDAIASLTANLASLPAGNNAVFTTSVDKRTGTFTWTPTFNDSGGPFNILVTADNALSTQHTLAIHVANTDRAPVVTSPVLLSVAENVTVTVPVTVVDPDGDAIASLAADVSALPSVNDAVFTVGAGNTSGTLTWRPRNADGRVLPYDVVFTATNALIGKDTTGIKVDLRPVVTITPSSPTVGEGQLVTLDITAVDPDGQPITSLTANLTGLPVGHDAVFVTTLDKSAGTLTWTPSYNDSRVAPYTVTVTAGNALIGASAATIRVNNTDRAPVVTAPATQNAVGGSLTTVSVTAVDPDGDAIASLTPDLSGFPAGHGATWTENASHTGGTLSWTPSLVVPHGPHAAVFVATNALAGSATTQVGVDQRPVITVPGATPGTEGIEVAFDITATDMNGEAIGSLTADVSALPAGHNAVFTPTIGNTGGHFSWTPSYSDAGGPYLVSFTGANALSGTSSVAITVTNVDRAPVVTAPATRTIGEGAVLGVTVAAADPDGQPITSLTADLSALPPAHNAVFVDNGTHTGGTLSWTPSYADAGGPYTVSFTATNALTGSTTTAITVTNTDRAPVVTAPAAVPGNESGVISIEVAASDPDNQPISFLTADLAGLPAGNNALFTTNATRTAGTLSWTPTFDDGRGAPYNVTFTAFNGMAGTFTTAITVNDDNRNPVVTAPPTATVTENSPMSFNFTASDPDGEAIASLTADLSGFPAGNLPVFTANPGQTAGTFAWTPSFADARGTPYRVTFTASNSSNGVYFTDILVNNLDRLPVVTAPAGAAVIENQTVTVNVTAVDPDGEAITLLSANLSTLPAGHGATFVPNGTNTAGTLTWTPSPSAVRAAPYNIVFSAVNALSGTSTTSITVNPDNLLPVAALTASPPAVVAPAMVVLSAAGSVDNDGSIASYTFDFGDGQTLGPQASPTAAHAYAAGLWSARVITIDNLGGRDTAVVDVNANLSNLVANRGFETNTTGWAAQGSVTLSRVAGGHSGGFQLQLQGGSSASAAFGTQDNPNVVATVAGVGRRYRFGGWVRSDAHTGRLNLEVREFVGTSTQQGPITISPPVTLSPTWQYLTVDHVVTVSGTNLDLRVVDTPNSASQRFFLDDVSIALVPLGDQAPMVTAPAAASVVRNNQVTVNVTALDPDGQALTSLLANLSGLPAGNNALFTTNAGNTGGTLTWTPTAANIRPEPYTVTFTSANALSGTATTSITVTDSSALVNRVSNPGFETDLSGWLAYASTLTRVAGGRTGGFCARAQGTSTASSGIDDAVLTVTGVPMVGARYRFSAWIRSDNSTRGVKIRVYEKTASGSAIGSTFYSPEVLLSPTWKEVTVDYLTRQAGSTIDFKITNYPAVSGEVLFVDDVLVALVPAGPVAPLVQAPTTALGSEGAPITVSVTAASQDGQPISSFTADLTDLPAGHTAVFTAGAGNTTGTLTWTPAAAHARVAPYMVRFRAVGSLTGLDSTAITVADTTAGANLVANPGFETNTTGWAANGTVTLSRLTATRRTGAAALQLRGGSSATALFGTHDNPNVVATVAGVGRRYRYGAWMRGLTATDTGSVALELREFSGATTQVGATVTSPAAKLSMNWQFVTADFVVTTAGTNLDLRAICTPKKANETWLMDDVTIFLLPSGPPPPQPPVVTAPATASVLRNHQVTVNVTASDADGPAIASLTANLTGLPAGHNAVFTAGAGNTTGTLTWTPTPADIRAAPYAVTFTADNALSGTTTTSVTVTDSATTVNLVTNSGFETDLSGWVAYSAATLTRVAGGHSGGFSVRAQGTSTSSFGIDDSPNTVASVPAAGTRYRFSAWIRSDNSTRAVKMRIYELQGGSQLGPTFYSPEVTLAPTWKLVTVDYTTQQAGTALNLRITDYPTVANEVFFIDDVSIELIPSGTSVVAQAGDPEASVPSENVPVASAFRAFVEGDAAIDLDATDPAILRVEGFDGPAWEGFVPQFVVRQGDRELVASGILMGEDADANGHEELAALFSTEELARLFAGIPAEARTAPVTLEVRGPESLRQTVAFDAPIARRALVFEARFTPNPFRRTGTLAFTTTRRGPLKADIFDVNGRRMRSLMDANDLEPGRHKLPLDAQDAGRGRMAAGVYFYRVEAREGILRGRFVLVK